MGYDDPKQNFKFMFSKHGRRQRGAGGPRPPDFQTWYKYNR